MARPKICSSRRAPHARGQQQHAGDHHHVEHHRPQRRHKEVAARVGHADEHRGQAHQQHVGKHQAQQPEHEPRLVLELPGGQREGDAQHRQHRHRPGGDGQPGDNRVGGTPHFGFPLFDFLLLEDGDEGRGQRPFTQEPAEEVGHLEGEDEGARDRAAAHERRIDHLAHHPQHPAGQRRGGHRAGGFQHLRHRARSLKSKV